MATRGSIPKMMELAGIEMLPPDAGIPWIRRELTAGGARGEVVVARALGVLMNEWDPAGGLDPLAAAAPGPMVGRLAGMGIHGPLTVETQLDPAVQPFLHDHQIEGTPVLPGVMGVEAFAEAALAVFPGWRIDAVEDVSFQSPFKFYRREPRAVRVEAVFHPEGEDAVAVCRLMGSRTLANQEAPQITTHFTGRVRLTRRPLEPAAGLPPRAGGPSVTAEDIYRVYFHGPAYRVLARAWIDGSRIVGEMAANLPGNHHPPEQPLALEPRLLELCFQTVGLWELSMQSRMGLPHHAARVSPGRRLDLIEGTLYAVVTPHPEDQSFDADVVDAAGNRYLQLSGYRTVALAEGVNAEPLIGLRRQGGEDKELSATAD